MAIEFEIIIEEWRCLTFTGIVEAETEDEASQIALDGEYEEFTKEVSSIEAPGITSIVEAQATGEGEG